MNVNRFLQNLEFLRRNVVITYISFGDRVCKVHFKFTEPGSAEHELAIIKRLTDEGWTYGGLFGKGSNEVYFAYEN